jgi:hypothetical protein
MQKLLGRTATQKEKRVKRLIELNGDSYIVEFAMDGSAKVSKKNSSQPLTIDEVILVLREYQLGKGKPIQ